MSWVGRCCKRLSVIALYDMLSLHSEPLATESQVLVTNCLAMKSRLPKTKKFNRHNLQNPVASKTFLWVRLRIWLAFLSISLVGLGLLAYQWQNSSEARRLEEACSFAKDSQDWPKLEQFAVKWGLLQPTRFEPFILAAQAAEQLGDKARTAAYLLEMPTNAPVPILLQLSYIQYQDLYDPVGSIKTCERVLQREPKNSEAHERLLFFWTMARNTPKIRQEANRGIREGSATIVTYAYLFGAEKLRFKDALETNRRWLAKSPKEELFLVPAVLSHISLLARSEPNNPTEEADLLEMRMKVDSDLKRLSEDFPSNREVIAARMEREMERGNDEAVEKMLNTGAQKMDDDNRLWRARAWLHSLRGENPKAKEACDEAIRLVPMDWQAYLLRATVFRQLGNLAAAEKDSKIGYEGSELTQQLNSSSKVFSLESNFYERLASFAELCDQSKIATNIRVQLKNYVPSVTSNQPK